MSKFSESPNSSGVSLLSRGAWIEIKSDCCFSIAFLSLLSRGAWIEIQTQIITAIHSPGRSSHEERGLKLSEKKSKRLSIPSLLSRGAWIEMTLCVSLSDFAMSLLSRGAWIEIYRQIKRHHPKWKSLLSRGAWIEMSIVIILAHLGTVAPLTRSVD